MNQLEKERRLDSRERNRERHERHESKEAEVDPELQAAASKERADYLVKEVKSATQNMQNIILHMQQVQQAIAALRAQLQIANDDDAPSVVHDQARVSQLQQNIASFQDELKKMRGDLVQQKVEELKQRGSSYVSFDELQRLAEDEVNKLGFQIVSSPKT
ncbi:MAG: hypothetical protein A3J66_01600 [Candidatus Magasanikbacteria bacterium RIFCSPHIGHO2_02_FULL_47_14]|uniref:Uncharacterized protein n=1 Tax=Candidatus Magasanikbacteria bacterium RIFCSPHIGHO2_02_FULL_47_14 TaxID=1798680 RepID=A0A1F6LYS0_9BACT|nr:MAG: hypothetical protein A3J66_01600 [Candidatus Magasanikbacteria bacterium RIFCSPHIGHO2_02_FULL_47_14]